MLWYDIPKNVKAGIYKLTSPNEPYYYIGSAKNLKKRFYEHSSALTRNVHSNPHVQNRYNKHKISKWVFNLIEESSESKLLETEQKWLNRCSGNPFCMNCNPVANQPPNKLRKKLTAEQKLVFKGRIPWNKGKKIGAHTEEHKRNISIAKTGKHHNYGYKISLAQKGHKKSLEWRLNISKALMGNKNGCKRGSV